MPGTEATSMALHIVEKIFEQEEFGMMTKQAELKKQAYASMLKSRALSVLIYLIDRSNKELTCFPAIPTMAEQLHISISTVKRALHELLDAGYIKKDARFREKNKGQTSNLYTLVLFEGKPTPDDGQDCASGEHTESEMSAEASQEKAGRTEKEMCQVEHISFDILKGQKEEGSEAQTEEVQENIDESIRKEDYREICQENRTHSFCTLDQIVKQPFITVNEVTDFSLTQWDREKSTQDIPVARCHIKSLYLWTGAGVSLIPP